jgi:hypothetical protein
MWPADVTLVPLMQPNEFLRALMRSFPAVRGTCPACLSDPTLTPAQPAWVLDMGHVIPPATPPPTKEAKLVQPEAPPQPNVVESRSPDDNLSTCSAQPTEPNNPSVPSSVGRLRLVPADATGGWRPMPAAGCVVDRHLYVVADDGAVRVGAAAALVDTAPTHAGQVVVVVIDTTTNQRAERQVYANHKPWVQYDVDPRPLHTANSAGPSTAQIQAFWASPADLPPVLPRRVRAFLPRVRTFDELWPTSRGWRLSQ